MKSYINKVGWCPVCAQGWVQIVKDVTTQDLFVCCSECETEWKSPNDIDKKNSGTHGTHGKISEPLSEEINQKGWASFVKT